MLEALSEIAGPEGDMEAARLMVPVNPFKPLRVIVEAPEEPAVMVRLLGLAFMMKSGRGEGLTVTVTMTM